MRALARVGVAAARLAAPVSEASIASRLRAQPASRFVRSAGTDTAPDAHSDEHKRSTAIRSALELEEIDVNLFRAAASSLWKPPNAKGVFGGQIIGQAMRAAHMTVHSGFPIHAAHGFFLLPGSNEHPVIYEVERLRDGRSFETRAVTARQRGKAVFQCTASFHRPEESPPSMTHQVPMPMDAMAEPESLPSAQDVLRGILNDPRLDKRYVPIVEAAINTPFPVDVRQVTRGVDPFRPRPQAPRQLVWMRVDPAADLGDDPDVHRCMVAYMSDWQLCTTSLLPAGLHLSSPQLGMLTSLDHSMWFRERFRADEWLLYEMNSPASGHCRGLNEGRIFRRDGTLAVITAQEALVRPRAPPSTPQA